MMTEERLAEMKQEIKIEVLRKAKRREIIETLAEYIFQVPARVKPPKVVKTETSKEKEEGVVVKRWFRRNPKVAYIQTITKTEHFCPECGKPVSDTGYCVGFRSRYIYFVCECGWEYAGCWIC